MNRIRLLPENVANQIAAGEVVERPASVVKELVENALDAQARSITVEIQSGGKSLIRVTDDGTGMNRDDALLCLERHATSKIKLASDLQAVLTMGFRGEALPSLASVSRMILTTRDRESTNDSATQIIVHGGKIIDVKEAGAPFGTCIEARNLFFNLPARRKFLRSDETERAHIQHYLILVALAFPSVTFTFIQEGRTLWKLPGTAQSEGQEIAALEERWKSLYHDQDRLMRVDFRTGYLTENEDSTEYNKLNIPVRVWGLIGAPGVSRATRESQHLFVNHRPVENRALNFALIEGYHNTLMKGRYPVGVLFIDIPPSEVDVNIHPAKREVKFHHEAIVRQAVSQAVRQALLRYHGTSHLPEGSEKNSRGITVSPPPASPTIPLKQETMILTVEPTNIASNPIPENSLPPYTAVRNSSILSSTDKSIVLPDQTPQVFPPASRIGSPEKTCPSPAPPPVLPISTVGLSPAPVSSTPLLAVPLKLIGVLNNLYVLLESDRGLVLLDQHAAHERILFEQLLKSLEQGHAPAQRLLLPETVELTPKDAQFLRDQLTILSRLGVELSEFGERTFLLDALPPFVKCTNPRSFVLELLDDLKQTGECINSWRLGEDLIAKTVCRKAVKANDPLTQTELNALLDDLRRCQMPYTCPHGRPTLIEMSFRELEKRFGRTK